MMPFLELNYITRHFDHTLRFTKNKTKKPGLFIWFKQFITSGYYPDPLDAPSLTIVSVSEPVVDGTMVDAAGLEVFIAEIASK
jgi:hypothetical protein